MRACSVCAAGKTWPWRTLSLLSLSHFRVLVWLWLSSSFVTSPSLKTTSTLPCCSCCCRNSACVRQFSRLSLVSEHQQNSETGEIELAFPEEVSISLPLSRDYSDFGFPTQEAKLRIVSRGGAFVVVVVFSWLKKKSGDVSTLSRNDSLLVSWMNLIKCRACSSLKTMNSSCCLFVCFLEAFSGAGAIV